MTSNSANKSTDDSHSQKRSKKFYRASSSSRYHKETDRTGKNRYDLRQSNSRIKAGGIFRLWRLSQWHTVALLGLAINVCLYHSPVLGNRFSSTRVLSQPGYGWEVRARTMFLHTFRIRYSHCANILFSKPSAIFLRKWYWSTALQLQWMINSLCPIGPLFRINSCRSWMDCWRSRFSPGTGLKC